MSRPQAHILLQHQYQHQTTTTTNYCSTMATLPRIRELGPGLGANGGNGLKSPLMNSGGGVHPPTQHLGHAGATPPVPPQLHQTSYSRAESCYVQRSVTRPVDLSPWKYRGKGKSTEVYQYEQHTAQQQQQQQQHKSEKYQPSTTGRMQQPSQMSSPSLIPAKQYASPMQKPRPVAVETWWHNEYDSPWNPLMPTSQVADHMGKVDKIFARSPSPGSGALISLHRSRKASCSITPGLEGGTHHEHNENARQVSAGLIYAPEHHERSASCPTLHLTSSTLISPRNTSIPNGNYSSTSHERPLTGARGSSPQTPKALQSGICKNLEDPSMNANRQRVEAWASHKDVVLGSKPTVPTTWDAATTPTSHASLHGPQETRLSNKSPSDLTSTAAGAWKQILRDSPPPYAANYYHNTNTSSSHKYPRPETIGASRGSTCAGDSNAMDDYESDRQPSQTPRASMASSTTSSEATNTRMSDSGKRRSIGAPKREYRCTKQHGCDAIFTCNSLRK